MFKINNLIDNTDRKYIKIIKEMFKSYDKRINNIDNYQYVSNLSTDEVGAWINKREKKIIIAFRSNIYNFRDLKTDTYLTIGLIKDTNRFKDNLKQVTEIKNIFKNYSYIFTGGKLGGKIAIEMIWIYIKDICVVFSAECKKGFKYRGLNIKYYCIYENEKSVIEEGDFKNTIVIEKMNVDINVVPFYDYFDSFPNEITLKKKNLVF